MKVGLLVVLSVKLMLMLVGFGAKLTVEQLPEKDLQNVDRVHRIIVEHVVNYETSN